MQNKQIASELYENLVQALLKNKDKKLREQHKSVYEYMEKYYTDAKIATVNTKRPKGVEKLITALVKEVKQNTITYMEAVKSGRYIWIVYRTNKGE